MRHVPLYDAPVPPAAVEQAAPLALDAACERCPLHLKASRPCLPDEGEPGGLLVVGEMPGREDDAAGRPFLGRSGDALRQRLRSWDGPLAMANAVRCFAGSSEVKDAWAEECRGFLAATVREARPRRVVALGGWAMFGLLGRSPPALSVRRGYGWLSGAAWGGPPAPVFLLQPAAQAARNRWLRRWWEEDLEWALRCEPPAPPFGGVAHVVETEADALEAEAELRLARWCSFDVETAGRMYDGDYRIIAASFTPQGSLDSWCWRRGDGLEDPGARAALLRLVADPGFPKVVQNAKHERVACELGLGVRMRGLRSDTLLKRALLDAGQSGKLEHLAEMVGMGGHKEEAEAEMEGRVKALKASMRKTKPQPLPADHDMEPEAEASVRVGAPVDAQRYALLPRDVLARYNGRDTVSTALLEDWLAARMAGEPEVSRAWEQVTRHAVEAVAQMELWGAPASVDAIEGLARMVDAQQREVWGRIRAHAHLLPPDFNPNSKPQLREIFFGKLGLKPHHLTKKARLPAVDEATLLSIADQHPLAGALADWNSLVKMRGTYADGGDPMAPQFELGGGGMLQWVRGDGRIHPSVRIEGTDCMPAGELVLTSRGYLPVEDVRPGDLVLTHEGRPRPVVDVVDNGVADVWEVELDNGLRLRTTGNHEYRVALGLPGASAPRAWRPAAELRRGDRVVVHSGPEEWRAVLEWPYEVSSWGRVRRPGGEPLALQRKGRWGHLKVTLSRNGAQGRGPDRRDFAVHRLVAAAFSSPGKGPELRHLNGVAWDNTARNLRRGTSLENKLDAIRHGTMSHRQGPQAKLTAAVVEEIRRAPRPARGGAGRWHRGSAVSDAELARRLGVSRELVRDVRAGKRWAPNSGGPERASFGEAQVVRARLLGPMQTHGLTVGDDHSHVTGGVVTHNTGRMSCTDPNLFNIPRAETPEGKACRDIFRAPPGWVILNLDFSQLELRVAAMLSGDAAMRAAFTGEGGDLHLATARLIAPMVWGMRPEEAGKKERQFAKTTNFRLAYEYDKSGRGLAMKLTETARQADPKAKAVTVQEACRIRQAVLGAFKQFDAWREEQVAMVRREGHVWTYWNGQRARRRWLWRAGDLGAEEYVLEHASNQAVNCLDAKTEALTLRGWVPGFELRRDDVLLTKNAGTGLLEWQPMTDLRLFPDYEGPLVEFKSRSFGAVTTPEHRWLVHNKSSGRDECRTSARVLPNGDHRIHRTGRSEALGGRWSDDFVELAGWFLTDGFIGKRVKEWRGRTGPRPSPFPEVGLCQSRRANPGKVARIDALLERAGVKAHRSVSARTECVYWRFRCAEALELVREFPDRELTVAFAAELSAAQARLLLDTMVDGDGCRSGKVSFVAKSERHAAAFQALCCLCGVATSCRPRDMSKYVPRSSKMGNVPRGGVHWVVTLLSRKHAQVLPGQKREYVGREAVWCPVVPNTFFVARRDGQVFVTGNTPVQGSASDLCLASLIQIVRWLRENAVPAMVILTVYDSIMLQVREGDAAEVAWECRRIMQGWPSGGVPLVVDVEAGQSWGSMEKMALP